MNPGELVGFRELPELLGVSRTTAARYAQRPDFPAPVDKLASGRVWRRADVQAWKKRTPRPRPGPRPKQEE